MKTLCEVCNTNESYGVYSSACGPISLAYCIDCGRKGAEPVGLLAAYISTAVNKGSDAAPEKELINSSYQKIINVSIEVANVTRDDFYKMIDNSIQKEKEYFESMSAMSVEKNDSEDDFK